ncbi:MAG: hypothetical protein ACREQF_07080 [Candidatus Binataceae bacterium]
MRYRWWFVSVLALVLAWTSIARAAGGGDRPLVLWVDQKTGQLFAEPGPGRKSLKVRVVTDDDADLERKLDEKVETKTKQAIKRVRTRCERSSWASRMSCASRS